MSELDVQACTDVTGFGLLVHLYELCQASACASTIKLNAIPLLAGAEALAEKNIRSTLYTQNRQTLEAITWDENVIQNPRFDLLFDPQTSGGLLAGIPAKNYNELDESFHRLFYTIGEVTHLNDSLAQIKLDAS